MTKLSNIEQSSLVSRITQTNDIAVKVEAAFANEELTSGYYVRALGLYATDPDEGEILTYFELPLKEVQKQIKNGTINDAKTICALARVSLES